MTPITSELPYLMEMSYGDPLPGRAQMEYDGSDPYAILLVISQPDVVVKDDEPDRPWAVGRSLLLEGHVSDNWVGQGTIHVRRANQKYVAIKLWDATNSLKVERYKVLLVSAHTLKAFLDRSVRVVPLGKETEQFDWNELEAEALSWS